MSFVKKLPWASLMLLLVTYGAFGWLLYAWTISWKVWLLMTAIALLTALALTAPFELMRICLGALLKSDTTAFISIILGSFAAVILLRWFPFFAHFLILLSAASLARLDIQLAGFSGLQAFLILAIFSLSGLSLGLLTHQQLVIHHLST
jgi:hypothetical protein